MRIEVKKGVCTASAEFREAVGYGEVVDVVWIKFSVKCGDKKVYEFMKYYKVGESVTSDRFMGKVLQIVSQITRDAVMAVENVSRMMSIDVQTDASKLEPIKPKEK